MVKIDAFPGSDHARLKPSGKRQIILMQHKRPAAAGFLGVIGIHSAGPLAPQFGGTLFWKTLYPDRYQPVPLMFAHGEGSWGRAATTPCAGTAAARPTPGTALRMWILAAAND